MWCTLFWASALASLVATVSAQASVWQQCGGIGWSGATTCVTGATCTRLNDWYYQCLPSSNSVTSTSRTSITTSVSSNTMRTSTSTPMTTTKLSSTTTRNTATVTDTAAQSTNSSVGKQIRGVQAPVYHLYLQSINGKPQLGPEATSGYFVYGTTVALVMANGSKLYLNVDMSVSTSYKPLSFGATATTTNWGLSGDTFRVGNQQNFLVCPSAGGSNWDLYLQTGNDVLSSSCANYHTIHLPCLC